MRKNLAPIWVVCCLLATSRNCTAAQSLAQSGQICSPAMLDVSALPSPPSFTYGGHLFVLEVQNTSPAD
jgi:hypothetical protein